MEIFYLLILKNVTISRQRPENRQAGNIAVGTLSELWKVLQLRGRANKQAANEFKKYGFEAPGQAILVTNRHEIAAEKIAYFLQNRQKILDGSLPEYADAAKIWENIFAKIILKKHRSEAEKEANKAVFLFFFELVKRKFEK